MLSDIYNQRILELAGNIPRLGRLADPQASARMHSKLCGSTVIVDMAMAHGRVIDYAQDVKACALGQAAAAIVGRHVIGKSALELSVLRDQVKAMLKQDGPPPQGEWADVEILEPVRGYKARHASTLLAFEAAAQAAIEIDAKAAGSVNVPSNRECQSP